MDKQDQYLVLDGMVKIINSLLRSDYKYTISINDFYCSNNYNFLLERQGRYGVDFSITYNYREMLYFLDGLHLGLKEK